MGLSETRKLISVNIAILIAAMTVAMIISTVIGAIIGTQAVAERIIVKGDLVTQCSEQLDTKYSVLEAESGIPQRVFLQVKTDYSVESSLKRAMDDAYIGVDSTLYNQSMVDYFERLITEFMQGSELKYNEKDVKLTAQKAARIYSDTLGFHNTSSSELRLQNIKGGCSKAGLISLMVILLSVLIIVIIYAERQKGMTFVAAGFAGGGLGAVVFSLLCLIFGVWKKITLQPEALAEAIGNLVKASVLLIIPVGLVIALAAFITMLIINRKLNSKNERKIVV